jgi:hypothetical protein
VVPSIVNTIALYYDNNEAKEPRSLQLFKNIF